MPPKRTPDFDRVFLPLTVAVEKKINKLAMLMERLGDDDNVSDFQLRIVMTHTETLRGNLERLENNWIRLRDGIAQCDKFRLTQTVETTIANAEDTLMAAEMFMCSRGPGTRPEDADDFDPSQSRPGKPERLETALRPPTLLNRNMTLEEATRWIKSFDSYLNWNERIIRNKTPAQLRSLLENSLEAGMVSKLLTDDAVNDDTPIQGTGGLLDILGKYFVDEYPLINCRHAFSTCKQAWGKLFTTWWDTKLRKAKECNLETMRRDNWLALELIRGVSDATLQKKLLQEQELSLQQLVRIAEQWQAAAHWDFLCSDRSNLNLMR
jgi:hypothetical protein